MRSACYVGERRLELFDPEPRAPKEGEVAIDVAFTGICGTDLHILHGAMDARVTLPAVLGHEMSGAISAVGDGVTDWSVGDHVTVMPLGWCGHCPACRAGHHHVCHNLDFLGIDSPGSMQASWTVSQDVLVALPQTLSLEAAALAEPTAVAVHDVRRAGLRDGERALVVGGGPIGILIACVARAGGADVLVLELSEPRRAFAEALGLRARRSDRRTSRRRSSSTGPTAPAPTSPSRSRARSPASRRQSSRWQCAGASSWWRSTRRRRR